MRSAIAWLLSKLGLGIKIKLGTKIKQEIKEEEIKEIEPEGGELIRLFEARPHEVASQEIIIWVKSDDFTLMLEAADAHAGGSIAEFIGRALGMYKILCEADNRGARILFLEEDGSVFEQPFND